VFETIFTQAVVSLLISVSSRKKNAWSPLKTIPIWMFVFCNSI
jgi:hypothetical protein